jgi:hypothetical protein
VPLLPAGAYKETEERLREGERERDRENENENRAASESDECGVWRKAQVRCRDSYIKTNPAANSEPWVML